MKKLISMMMVFAMLLTLFVGCKSSEVEETTTETTEETTEEVTTEETTEETTEAQVEATAGALAVLEAIWNDYAEDEKFPVIGGNMEAPVDGAPGNYDMAYAENLTYNLLVPAESLNSVDEAATMIHMMNANTFTSGVVHLTEGTDVAAFAATMRDAVQGNQWMCGFPETLVIAAIGEYVLVSFGVNDAMNPFMTHLGEAYPEAEILYNEPIAG